MTFSRLQIAFVFIIYISISNHVIILPHLLKVARRDAWICVLIAYVILLIWGLFIHYSLKKIGSNNLYDWLEVRIGKTLTRVIILLFIVMLFVTAIISFNDLVLTVSIYFLPQTPFIIVSLTFAILCLYAAKSELKTIVYMSALLLPFIIFLGFFVAFATATDKTYSYLFPVFMNGYKSIIKGTLIVLGGSADFLIFFLLQHNFNKPFLYRHFFILITIVIGLTIGPTMGAITSFGPEMASSFRFPAFEQWRLVSLGKTITHVDFLAVFQLLAGVTIKVALCTFLIIDLIRIKSNRIKFYAYLLLTTLIFSFTLLPISDIALEPFLDKFLYSFAYFYAFVLSMIIFLVSFKRKRK